MFLSIVSFSSEFIPCNLTKTHNWVEWTAPIVSLSQTKVNDINLNDRPQMQNDTDNEIGRWVVVSVQLIAVFWIVISSTAAFG